MNEKKKKEIAVIGEEEFTLGFRLAGVTKTFDRENYTETIQSLLEREDLGIVIAHEEDIQELPKRVRNQVDKAVDPVVVALSEKQESERINEKIRKVIGADIT